MNTSKEFDWHDFNILANSYLREDNKAKQRTGVSRYYYGAFCTARDYLIDNNIYLNKKSEEKMTSKTADVHGETSKIFRKHKKFQKNNMGKTISKELTKLRRMRNKADYDKNTSDSLEKMIIRSKMKSEKIFELLKKLN